MFAATSFHPLDATKVQKLYFQTRTPYRVSINFGQNLSLQRSRTCASPTSGCCHFEYLKMITDDDGNVRRRLFFDNIRDFQGDNTRSNMSIAGTCCPKPA